MSNREKYRQFCQQHPFPIYLHSDWLDVVSKGKGDWDVVFSYHSNGTIRGYWPFIFKKQIFWDKLTMPLYTPYMGPRIIYPEGKNEYERISFENEVLEDLILQLPKLDDIQFKWNKAYTNWLPFYWNGFQQETRYTYCIEDTSDVENIRKQYKNSVQRQIKKASKSLQVVRGNTIEGVLNVFTQSMEQQSHLVDASLLKSLDDVAHHHRLRIILEAQDEQNKCVAAIYLLLDQNEILYLYGGYDKAHQDSGAMHLLFDHAIAIASTHQLAFNFEGSMLKGVERFFRSFGGKLTPVSFISKSKFPYSMIKKG